MPELHHLENQGWEQMQQLLNQHLPQEPKQAPVRPIRPLFMLVAAACMSALFCMPSLLTDSRYEPPYIMTLADNPLPKQIPNPGMDEFPMPQGAENGSTHAVLALKGTTSYPTMASTSASPTTGAAGTATKVADNHSSFAVGNYNSSFIADSSLLATAEIVKTAQALPSETVSATADDKQLVRLPMIDFPMPAPTASDKITMLKKQAILSVAAQLNRNLTGSHFKTDNALYNLPVYPSVTASVHINKAISFTTGISVLASGHFDKQSVSETSTPIGNNSQVSTMAVVDKDQIRQAYYWQIPVTMDVAVRRNVSVSSGAGFAFLQKVAVQREARITDDNATQYVRPVTTPPVVNTVLNRAEIQETPAGKLYNVKGSERRFLFNVQYQLKKFTLGLQYSRALSPSVVFPEHPELNIRNETLTLSVGFRLFH